MTVKPVTTEGKLLAKISGQLDELIGILRPEPTPTEPETSPVAGEPEKKPVAKKAPAKKAATRKRVTGQ